MPGRTDMPGRTHMPGRKDQDSGESAAALEHREWPKPHGAARAQGGLRIQGLAS